MDNISFNGGFWIKSPKAEVWNSIKAEFPSSKCVFEEFNEQGDKFFAIKSVYDKAMTGFLWRNKIEFKLYPDLNLKNRLDPWNLEESKKIIDAQTNILETEDEIKEFIRTADKNLPVIMPKYRWKPNDHIEKTYKAIGLNPTEYSHEITDGITYIKNKNGKIVAQASPNNAKGVNFIYVYPKNHDESSQKFALSQSGEKYYFGPFEMKNFYDKFMLNVKIDLGRKRPQNV